MSHVGLIVKSTRLCNLRCEYCYDWRAGPDQTMTFATLSRLVRTALVDTAHQRVDFAWHGGEPTTLPVEFYEKALWLQARYRRPGQLVSNSIMTNATRLDDQWLDFLGANRFSVGVSLDGPPEVHDAQRRDVKGRPTYTRVLAGIEGLRGRGMDVGVVMVVDRATLRSGARALLDFVVTLELGSIGLNFVMPPASAGGIAVADAGHYISSADKSRFLIELYDAWVEHGDPALSIRELDETRARLDGRLGRACTHRGSCFGELFVVDPNGDVSHCSYFGGDDRYRWGNVNVHSFAQIRQSLKLRAVRHRRAADLASLRACPDFEVCLGGCPHDLYAARRHDAGHREGCCGMAPLLAHLRAHPAQEPVCERPSQVVSVRPPGHSTRPAATSGPSSGFDR